MWSFSAHTHVPGLLLFTTTQRTSTATARFRRCCWPDLARLSTVYLAPYTPKQAFMLVFECFYISLPTTTAVHQMHITTTTKPIAEGESLQRNSVSSLPFSSTLGSKLTLRTALQSKLKTAENEPFVSQNETAFTSCSLQGEGSL